MSSTNPNYEQQLDKISNSDGFIAALDQSGGSTPKALKLYGVPDDHYVIGEPSMFDVMHSYRQRIMMSPKFNGDKIIAAILFENTLCQTVNGKPTAQYLWDDLKIVPILKIDEGLMPEHDGVQLMKEMKKLNVLLDLAVEHKVFGTKARSFIKNANAKGIKAIVEQQFTVARTVMQCGLHPIIEPEVDIKLDDEVKRMAEIMLKESILENLNKLHPDEKVLLKLTLPSVENFYKECIDHPNVLRVVALSGGYDRNTANELLAKNEHMVASFSRALTEGLHYDDTPDEFDEKLDASIASIYAASMSEISS